MCGNEKQSRNSYKVEVLVKATRKLEAIHFDVCEPFEVKSLRCNNYFVTFIY